MTEQMYTPNVLSTELSYRVGTRANSRWYSGKMFSWVLFTRTIFRQLLLASAATTLAFIVLFAYPSLTLAASLSVSPASGDASVGSTINVILSTASDATAIHALSGTLSFPANLLEVMAVSKSQSLVSTWVQEPIFLNTAGTLQFSGEVPNPGFQGTDGRVLFVTFKVKAPGTANLAYTAGSIVANDGDGTEILTSKTGATYTLVRATLPAVSAATIPRTTAVSATTSGLLPRVNSLTHPDGAWSHATSGTFNFVFPSTATVTALRLLADDKPNTLPTVTYAPAITTRDIKNLPEGISYLHVQYKTAAGWGTVLHYKLQIDTTAPTTFTISQQTPGIFTFVSNDALSGILRYDVQFDGGVATAVTDDGSHTFTAPDLSAGAHTILVRAFDTAGNVTESSLAFSVIAQPAPVAPVVQPTPVLPLGDTSMLQWGTTAIAVLSVVTPLCALVLVFLWLLYVAWRTRGGIVQKINREIAEARAAVEQSGIHMRTEFNQDIALLQKASLKRKLTREETKILKHLQTTSARESSTSE